MMNKEAGLDISPLLNLFRIITPKGMNQQDILNLMKFAKEIPYLKDTYDQLVKDVDDLDYKKCKFSEELSYNTDCKYDATVITLFWSFHFNFYAPSYFFKFFSFFPSYDHLASKTVCANPYSISLSRSE
jgi:hypothetical protein